MAFEYWIGGTAVVALAYAAWRAQAITSQNVENDKARDIAQSIRDVAMAFLNS